MNELLLGFDIRVNNLDLWGKERRDIYLLRKDVEIPKSVDGDVWHMSKTINSILKKESLEKNWDFNLIMDLNGLIEKFQKANEPNSSLIAISVISNSLDAPMASAERIVSPLKKMEHFALFDFLGYDVADEWQTSGLMNCGYLPEEIEELQKFAPKLNEHHLFAFVDDAISFKSVSDVRVPEHAPFYVYGLYKIKSLLK